MAAIFCYTDPHMTIRNKITKTLATILTAASLIVPAAAGAATGQTYTQDTDLVVAAQPLKILAGSQADSLTTQSDGFTVTVASGEVFAIRYPGTHPGSLENDGNYASCDITSNRDNQMFINGPKTVTVRPTTVGCSTSNYLNEHTPGLNIGQPNGGETLKSGDAYQIFWTTSGNSPASVRLRLSTDGGLTFPTTLASNLINNGFYAWTVPTITTTTHARIKIEGFNQMLINSMDLSNADFTIQGTAPPAGGTVQPPPPTQPTTYDYNPQTETTNAATIDIDRGYTEPEGVTAHCAAGARIKSAASAAVYYCGRDAKRHAFPNRAIHDSWYVGFNGVITLTDAELAMVPLGANVTYRPGVRMIKVQTDPKVYAVAKDGTLRFVPDEWTAKALYGDNWNTKIDDLSDAFFVNYKTGATVRSVAQ